MPAARQHEVSTPHLVHTHDVAIVAVIAVVDRTLLNRDAVNAPTYRMPRLIAIAIKRSNNINALRYMLTDHQGSVDAVTNESAQIVERFSYDPFGQRRSATWQDNSVARLAQDILSAGTESGRRGYTGHEMLDGVALIHMNGRVYDPRTGRFLSADVTVQFASLPQSYNRYSYVMNNPLSFTDPSGYLLNDFIGELFEPVTHMINGFMNRYGQTIVSLAFAAMLADFPPLAGFVSGFAGSGGDLKSAAIGALTASMFNAVGNHFGHVTTAETLGQKMIAHAAVGGLSSALQGGNFLEGFAAAFVTQGLSLQINQMEALNKLGKVAVAALAGGATTSAMGGKFANGAVTGAFSRLFNDEGRRGGVGFDERGEELFEHWLGGTGDPLIRVGGAWGEYMGNNELLAEQIDYALTSDALGRASSGAVDITFHGEIENGYATGYEMLHGSHGGLGDVRLLGYASINSAGGVSYQVTATWNDRIDPNFTYRGDRVLSQALTAISSPKDYNVHISWSVSRRYGN